MKLLKVDTINQVYEKLDYYFQNKFMPDFEEVSLRESAGRYLAEDILSDMDLPPFTRSVVDGYAVMAKDTFGTGDSAPAFLNVIGSVEMGKAADYKISPGETVYIPTGGMLPQGADSVVMIEFTEQLDEKTIAVYKPVSPNTGLMNKGDDYKKDELLYEKGHRISVKDIGMLAAMGKSKVKVFRKPKITVVSTGDEIIDIDKVPKDGEIRDINSYTVSSFAESTGAEILQLIHIGDNLEALRKGLSEALEKSDIVLLSGGSSAGNKDHTAEIIDLISSPGVITHGIAIKPGKPTIIGVSEEAGKNSKLLVGLPGHPMAAILVYSVIVDYFIRKYYFLNSEKPFSITARISENVHSGEGRQTYQLVSLEKDESSFAEWIAKPIHAKSGSISQLIDADGYVVIHSLSEGVKANDLVEVSIIGK